MRIALISLAVAAGAVALYADAPAASAEKLPRHVYCHYVAWHDWNSANKAYQRYYDAPMAHPTGDRQRDYQQEFATARATGVNTFVVDLVNADAFAGQTMEMLKAAEGSDFKIAVCLDGFNDTPANYAKKVAAFLTRAGAHPNYERVAGKPVVFTFWGFRRDAEWWKSFRNILRDDYKQEIFIVGDPADQHDAPATAESIAKHAGCFDAFYSFGEHGRGGTQSPSDAHRAYQAAAPTAALAGQWVGGITPGYTGAWPLNKRNDYYIPFRGLDLFLDNIESATEKNADALHLTTWNDLDETPFQPMMFQFHTYQELIRFYVDRWRGVATLPDEPRVYAAYQREQLIGTTQRLEIVSLPTTSGEPLRITCDLLDAESGQVLQNLPSQNVSTQAVTRCDWAIDTSKLAQSAAVTPRLHITRGDVTVDRTLPLFRLRTGWIANKVIVKVPAHEMAPGDATLKVEQSGDQLQAHVTLPAGVDIRFATLWRNDRPVGTFQLKPDEVQTDYLLAQQSATPANPAELNIRGGTLSGLWRTDAPRKDDLLYVRCELPDGRTLFSNAVTPFAGNARVTTNVIRTAIALDTPAGIYITAHPTRDNSIETLSVHPAAVQTIAWNFAGTGAEAPDTAGRTPLDLGTADAPWYPTIPARIPKRFQRDDGAACLQFDGKESCAQIPGRQLPLGAFVVTMDVQPATGREGQMQSLLGRIGTGSAPVIRILPDGRLEAGRSVGKSDVMIRTSKPLPPSQWAHVVLTYDCRQVLLTVNGHKVGRAHVDSFIPPYDNSRPYLGGVPGEPFCGSLANVRIESVAR